MIFPGSNALQNAQSIHLWQHQIEDDQVIALISGKHQARFAILCAVHGEAWSLPQSGSDIRRQPDFVLNHQNAHVEIIYPATLRHTEARSEITT
jgi:hypothetical protein